MARILHISVTAGADPTGKIACRLAKSATDNGHEAIIAFGRRGGVINSQSSSYAHIAGPVDLMIHGAATRLLDRHALQSTASSQRLHNLIEQYRPQLIHLHNLHGYYLSLPDLCRLIAHLRIPTIMTLHDAWPLTGHCATPEKCRKFTQGCTGHCPHRSSYPAALISRSRQNLSDKADAFSLIPQLHIVAPSQFMLDLLAQSHLSHRPASLIYNGVDTSQFHPSDTARAPIVLAVSRRWTKAKGIDDLLELRRHLPHHLQIIAVGDIQPCHRLHRGITFTGALPSHQLIDHYRRAAVVINPSHGESFSLVKAEALACGTPVASYESGAAGELLTPPYGISVPTGNIVALAEATIQLATATIDPTHLHNFAASHFSLDTMLQKYNNLYNQLLK